jgi:enoyl-CoA hydratase
MIDQETHGNTLVLRINRPEARNAVNGDVAQGIEAGIDRIEEDDDLWVGVLTGSP